MARITSAEARLYRTEGDGETCFFCSGPAAMYDYTPSPAAPQMLRDTFSGDRVRVMVCDKCWRKIYTANVVGAGAKYGVQKGMMTLDHKRHLLGLQTEAPIKIAGEGVKFVLSTQFEMLMPANTLSMGDNKFLWNAHTLYIDELIALQGGMAMRMIGVPDRFIEHVLMTGLAAGDLDDAKLSIYREMLGVKAPNYAEVSD